MSSDSSHSIEVRPAGLFDLHEGERTRSRRNSSVREKVMKSEDNSARRLDLAKLSKELSSPEDPGSQLNTDLIVSGETVKHGVVKRPRNTKTPAEQYAIDSGKEDQQPRSSNPAFKSRTRI